MLDLDAIRRSAKDERSSEGEAYWRATALALLEHVGELEAALDYWKTGDAARDLAEACRQLRAADERIAALERALLPFAEQHYSDTDALLMARRLLGLPEFPPLEETFREIRARWGVHFDGVDPVAFVKELRGDDEA